MLLRSFVVVGLVGFVSLLGSNAVRAKEPAVAALSGVSFDDPDAQNSNLPRLDISMAEANAPRFSYLGQPRRDERGDDPNRRYEVALTATRGLGGLPVDVSIAQRASFGVNAQGDIARQSRGSELRLGRGLSMRNRPQSSFDMPAIYFFAASDDEAITWSPGSSNPNGPSPGFALQDRVEIGDMQAGLTYEAGPFQASVAYVKRKVSARSWGTQTVSSDESFTGLTLTMRH